jgi:transposase
MDLFIGLDVSQQSTVLCVVDAAGHRTWQGQCRTNPASLTAKIKQHAPNAARIGLESGPLSTWLWHELNALGLPIVCIDARHAKAVLAMQINKSDRNDALGLAQIVRTGWYREVKVKTFDSHKVRSAIGGRVQLVRMRVDIMNQIRGLLKLQGIILPVGQKIDLEQHISGDDILAQTLQALAKVLHSVQAAIRDLDRQIRKTVKEHSDCRLLQTIPGVGPLTALTFLATIDDPTRFGRSRSVGAYLGLTPKRYQSGDTDYTGRISRCGDRLLRGYLYEAANALLTRVTRFSTLKAWAVRIAQRHGGKKARVAIARKLSVIMHRMLITREPFRWSAAPGAADAA